MQHWKNPNSLSTAYAPSQLASQDTPMWGAGGHQPLTPAMPSPRPHEASEQSTGKDETDVLLTDERAQGQVRDKQNPMQNNKIGIQDKGPSVFSKFSSGLFLESPKSLFKFITLARKGRVLFIVSKAPKAQLCSTCFLGNYLCCCCWHCWGLKLGTHAHPASGPDPLTLARVLLND